MDLPIRFDDLLLLVVPAVRTHAVADLGVLAVVAKHGVNAGRLVVGATGVSLALRGAFLGIGHDSRLLFKSTALAVQTMLRSVIKNSMFRYFCCAPLGCNGERIIEQHPEKSMKIWHLHRICCACLCTSTPCQQAEEWRAAEAPSAAMKQASDFEPEGESPNEVSERNWCLRTRFPFGTQRGAFRCFLAIVR